MSRWRVVTRCAVSTRGEATLTDWYATILHLLGLDYQHGWYSNQNGLKEELTSVFEARVVKEILA